MPRKSVASTTTADPTGDISMASETPTVPSPKQSKDQQRDSSKPSTSTSSSGKKKEKDTQDKSHSHSHSHQQGDVISLDDLLLPRSIIQRLAKGVLPPNTSLQRDAVLALTKSATVFISLLASTANELTERKTVQSADVLKALREIEMEGFVGREGRVEREVEVWEKEIRGKRKGYRDRVKARESGGAGDTTAVGDTTVESVDVLQRDVEGEEHESKRVRIDVEGEGGSGSGSGGRDGSAGPITSETARIKLNGTGSGDGSSAGLKSNEVEMDDGDDIVDEDDESDQDDESDEAEDDDQDDADADDTRGTVEDSLDVDLADEDEVSRRRKNGTLAPDGRVEVGGSDDEDESD